MSTREMKETRQVWRLLAAGFVGVTLLLAACGDGDDEAAGSDELGLVTPGSLTVCTDVPYPPMEFEDASAPGGYTGFDIELMRAIAEDNGLDLVVEIPGWDAITSGLAMESNTCDISAASITITDEREENVDFSQSYFSAEQSLMVLAESPAVEVVSFGEIADMNLALEAQEVDGVVTDLVGNQGYIDDNGGAKIIEAYDTGELYGLAVKEEGSEDLLAAVNASLSKFQDDGTYDEIYGEWFSG